MLGPILWPLHDCKSSALELQGQFAFVCYDGNKKQVFAAR